MRTPSSAYFLKLVLKMAVTEQYNCLICFPLLWETGFLMLMPTFSFLFCCIPEAMRAKRFWVGSLVCSIIAGGIILNGNSNDSGKWMTSATSENIVDSHSFFFLFKKKKIGTHCVNVWPLVLSPKGQPQLHFVPSSFSDTPPLFCTLHLSIKTFYLDYEPL